MVNDGLGLKRCKFIDNNDSIISTIDSEELNDGPGLKRCKFIDDNDTVISVIDSEELNDGPGLKRCKFIDDNDTVISTIDSEELNDGPGLKRCKFIDDNDTVISTIDSDCDCVLPPLKRCNFVIDINDNSRSSINSLGYREDLSLACPLKRRMFSNTISEAEIEPMPELLGPPKEGQTLDLIRLLSNNGRTKYLVRSNGDAVCLDAVLGKHLVICCVSLPLVHGYEQFNSIITAYSELSRDAFEMVLVAHVDPDSYNGELLFNDFFSGLPCLAIPFSDFNTRHNIISFIGCGLCSLFEDPTAIVVDPSQTILHYHMTVATFYYFGSEWFPFHESNAKAIEIQDDVLRIRLDPIFDEYNFNTLTAYHAKWKLKGLDIPAAVMGDPLVREPLSLHKDILQCDPSLALPRIGAVTAPNQQSFTVSELSNKYVGLYLCAKADLILDVIDVHQQCTAKQKELVIVVVCVPIIQKLDCLQKKIKLSLEKYNISWFMLPDNSKVWRRLWRVFGQSLDTDDLVILPPNCKHGDRDGRHVIRCYDVKAYPFTRSSILERTFTAFKSLTPASLFKGSTKKRTCLVRNGRKSNVRQSALKGTRLLLYLDWLDFSPNTRHSVKGNWDLCGLLMKQYSKIQAMGWEVVFVPLNIEDTGERHGMLAKMPWLIMPLSDAVKASVCRKLFFPGEEWCDQLVAFEKDGRIVSREVKERLGKGGFNKSLFRDNLRKEIFNHLDTLRMLRYEEGLD